MRIRQTQSNYYAGLTIQEWREAGGNLSRVLVTLTAFVVTIFAIAVWA